MVSTVAPPIVSASKLRRQRAIASKERLFRLNSDADHWSTVQSQLAMLTSSLDFLVHHFIASSTCQGSGPSVCMNPCAPEFVPSETALVADSSSEKVIREKSYKGVWEEIDPWLFLEAAELACISQTCTKSLELVSTNTPFFNVFGNQPLEQSGETESPEPDGFESSCVETLETGSPSLLGHVDGITPATTGEEVSAVTLEGLPALTARQMRGLIDTVVAEIRLSPKWRNVPEDALAGLVEGLKAMYEDSDETWYSRSQAICLMELTGLKCGDLAARFKG